MDFALSDEQVMLHDSVTRFVADHHGFEQARSAAAEPAGFSRAHWRTFAELGWLTLLVPEEQGGFGGSAADAAIVMEGLGRGLVAAPFVSTAIIAPSLLSSTAAGANLLDRLMAGDLILALATEEEGRPYQTEASLVRATRDGDGYRIDGKKIVVPDGAGADQFIVSAQLDGKPALFTLPRETTGLEIASYRTIDGRPAADLRMADLALGGSSLLLSGEEAQQALERALDTARVASAAEALGCMSAATEQTAEYLKTRQQFGRTLSQFQVLTHRMADMFVRLENARSMLFRGLAHLDEDATQRARAVSGMMISILDAGNFVCGQAIQLHGGIGMADETMVGHFYKRLRAIGSTYGDREYHLQRYLSAPGERRQ